MTSIIRYSLRKGLFDFCFHSLLSFQCFAFYYKNANDHCDCPINFILFVAQLIDFSVGCVGTGHNSGFFFNSSQF